MSYDIRVGSGKSVIETPKGTVTISDSKIQAYIGNATYRLLYFNSPSLYTEFYDCRRTLWKTTCRTGIGTSVNDLPTWFIDTDYTPKQLKEDIILIISDREPVNECAKRLKGSSLYDPLLNMTGWDWLIMIFIVITVSVCVSWLCFIGTDSQTFSICKTFGICKIKPI